MKRLIEVLALWGMADAVFLAVEPTAWSSFWRRGVDYISSGKQTPRVFACCQFAFCLWLLGREEK